MRATRATRARPRPVSGQPVDGAVEKLGCGAGPARKRRTELRHAVDDARPNDGRRLRSARPQAPPPAAAASQRRGRSGRAARARPSRDRRRSWRASTSTGAARIAPSAAGTEVHRRDESEPRGEEPAAADASDRDDAVLERLAQRLEHRARELRQLVEEKHASMGEADLSGPRHRPAADHRGRRCAVVRRPERRGAWTSPEPGASVPATEWMRVTSSASSCVSGGRIDGSRRPSIVLPVPGGPASRRLWPPPRRARAPAVPAPAHGRRRGRGGRAASADPIARGRRVDLLLAPEVADRLRDVTHADGVDPGERRLARRVGRAEERS